MSLFNSPMQILQQIQRDPVSTLKQAGLNIPANMNNPQQIAQYLLQSGQVSQSQYQQAMQMLMRR